MDVVSFQLLGQTHSYKMMQEVNYDDVLAAFERVRPIIKRTPVVTDQDFNEKHGRAFYFKCENMQITGAFKIRRALNAVSGSFIFEFYSFLSSFSYGFFCLLDNFYGKIQIYYRNNPWFSLIKLKVVDIISTS